MPKLIASVWILLVIGWLAEGSAQPGDTLVNLLTNGNFEQGLEGWKLAGNGNADLVTLGGPSPLRTTSWAWVQQDLAMGGLVLGQTYVLTARVKNVGTSGCVLGFAAGSAKGQGTRVEQRLIFRGDWNTRSSILTLPLNTEWAAVFLAGTGDECLFENIRLQSAPALQPTPIAAIVANGGFEKGFSGWEVQGGELLRGVGLEGKQSLIARGNARLEQIVPAQAFEVGSIYELQASVSKNSGQGQCAVHLSGVSASGLSLSQQLIFEEATPTRSWLQKSALFSIPEDTAWITLQVETKNATCSFDSIRIVQQATAGTK